MTTVIIYTDSKTAVVNGKYTSTLNAWKLLRTAQSESGVNLVSSSDRCNIYKIAN